MRTTGSLDRPLRMGLHVNLWKGIILHILKLIGIQGSGGLELEISRSCFKAAEAENSKVKA